MRYEIDRIKEEFEARLRKKLDSIWLDVAMVQSEIESVGGSPESVDEIRQIAIRIITEKVNSLN